MYWLNNKDKFPYEELMPLLNKQIEKYFDLERKNMATTNTLYKKSLILAKSKLVACLLDSDFSLENPRPQTRNFPYTNTLAVTLKA